MTLEVPQAWVSELDPQKCTLRSQMWFFTSVIPALLWWYTSWKQENYLKAQGSGSLVFIELQKQMGPFLPEWKREGEPRELPSYHCTHGTPVLSYADKIGKFKDGQKTQERIFQVRKSAWVLSAHVYKAWSPLGSTVESWWIMRVLT